MALVVTIVVLIILATVSIKAVLGENGIIKKAKEAKRLHENSVISEDEEMNKLLDEYNNAMEGSGDTEKPDKPTDPTNEVEPEEPGSPGEPNNPSIPEEWDPDKVNGIDDGKGGVVPIPKDFYYVGGNINTGIVISDKEGDTMTASGTEMGNQFVWIPVASDEDLVRTDFDSNGNPTGGLSSDFKEPYSNEEATEYSTMKTQVLKYGGFYIGRYEAGVNSTTLRTGTTTAQQVVSKKGVAPYNFAPWGKSMYDPSEIEGKSGAVYLAKSFASQEGYTSVISTLCYGSQWDAMCRYIGDCNRKTPKKSKPELTGAVSKDVSKNIYDLAGNCYEWTMEAKYPSKRVSRGGNYNDYYSVSSRCIYDGDTTHAFDYDAFRIALYIK